MISKEYLTRALNPEPGHRGESFTVLEGEHAGEKGIAADGALSWDSEPHGFLEQHAGLLTDADFTGIREVDGTSVFCEALGGAKHLVICGAGHVALALCRMAKMVGLCVTIIEDRPSFAEEAKTAGADAVICADFTKGLEQAPGGLDTYFVIMTRAHQWDIDCMKIISKKPFAYVGMMGSGRRIAVVKERLLAAGVPENVVSSLHAPIGLPIRAETPEEIAVSVLAEIISIKNEKSRNDAFPEEIRQALQKSGRKILCTIVKKNGAAPRSAGSKMLVFSDGTFAGTIGGGLAEARILTKAKEILAGKESEPALVNLTLTDSEADRDGMICGGEMSVFLEEVL